LKKTVIQNLKLKIKNAEKRYRNKVTRGKKIKNEVTKGGEMNKVTR
jgi:hypothetical protein